MAAEGNRVGEHRVGVSRAAGQHGCAVFHLVVGAASLDEEAWTEQVPHVAVLLTAQRHTKEHSFVTTKPHVVMILTETMFKW